MTPSRFIPLRRARATAASLVAAATIAAAGLTGCGSGAAHKTTSSATSTATSSAASTATSSATSTAAGSSSGTSAGFTSRPFASGVPITHPTSTGKTSVTQPDDITNLGGHIFVGFQNGVGPQGETMMGNSDSTIVEFSSSGSPVAQWDVAGHVDGVTADSATGRVIVTVNEDAKSSLYVIDPGSTKPVRYRYPALPSHGGTDAVSIWHGMMLASASAPGTTGKSAPQASYPAVYVISLNASTHIASVRGLFGDEASAKRANTGATGTTHLALTDPDSNAVVPSYAPRFGGQFELTSQGDYQEIFTPTTDAKQLSVLKVSQSIDDSAWAPGPSATLYVTDGSADLIYKVTGPFKRGSELVGVTPCNAGNAPASCPGPGFPNPYLAQLDQATGRVTHVALSTAIQPAALLFVP